MSNSKFSLDVIEIKETIEPFALDKNGCILHDMPKLRESIDRLSDLIEMYIVIVDR